MICIQRCLKYKFILFFTILYTTLCLDSVCKNIESHKNLGLVNVSECGRSERELRPRIMGGKEAGLGEYPWMILMFGYSDKLNHTFKFCDGSIISKRYVLTAAHCVIALDHFPTYQMKVLVGEHDVNKELDCDPKGNCIPPPVEMDVVKKISHPGWNAKTGEHDIGLLRLNSDIEFNEFVQPICLPLSCHWQHKDLAGQSVDVVGWGTLLDEPIQKKANVLQKVRLKMAQWKDCKQEWQPKQNLTTEQMCAGGSRLGYRDKDACAGDSGGPLMILDQSNERHARYVQVGLVSGGDPCDSTRETRKPGIYTKITSYILWILDHIEP